MPILGKLDPPRAAWCNLRQALQWLRDEAVPVRSDFERALGEGRDLQEEEFGLQKKHLCAALLKGHFSLHGRPGIGLFKDNRVGLRPIYQHAGYDDYAVSLDAKGNIEIWFDEYGDQENIPIETIAAAGLRGFDFAAGKLTHITALDDKGRPARAWQYIDVVIATADLLREFPAAKPDDPLPTPLPEAPMSVTELRKATPAKIHETISAIYDYASAQCMKPPNLHDIAKHVLRRLAIEGLTATHVRIQNLAGDQRHADRRRKQGHRLYGSLLPFSDTEI